MILLDTHVLIWSRSGDSRLGRRARKQVEQASLEGEIAVSAISFWEAAMLHEKTPQDAKGSSSEVLVVGTVSPGGRLVVGQAALQAAVQVADEAVGEGAQRLVV